MSNACGWVPWRTVWAHQKQKHFVRIGPTWLSWFLLVWMRFRILHVSKLVAVPLGRSSDRGQLASGSSSASRRKQCLRFNLWSAEKLPNTGWHLLKAFFTFPYVCVQLFLIFNPWSTQLCRSFLVMSTSRLVTNRQVSLRLMPTILASVDLD